MIEVLPIFLTKMKISTLELDGNPLSFPPKNVCWRGTDAVLEYLKDYAEGTEKWNEVKIITIGDGGVGKVLFRVMTHKFRLQLLKRCPNQ